MAFDPFTAVVVTLAFVTLALVRRYMPRLALSVIDPLYRTPPVLPPLPPLQRGDAKVVSAPPVAESVPEPTPRPRPHYVKQPKKVISVAKAVDVLILFMNAEGHKGLFTADEIDEWWLCCCATEDIEVINPQFVREALEAAGLKVGQRRLNTPEYVHIRQRTGMTRCTLYRIPHRRGMADKLPAAPVYWPEGPGEYRSSDGTPPAKAPAPCRLDDHQRRAA